MEPLNRDDPCTNGDVANTSQCTCGQPTSGAQTIADVKVALLVIPVTVHGIIAFTSVGTMKSASLAYIDQQEPPHACEWYTAVYDALLQITAC